MLKNIKKSDDDIQEIIDAENDIFQRNEFRDGLIRIFKGSDTPLVALLADKWGMGKTIFARRLESKIITDGDMRAIYFDAFANDYQKDVFTSIAAQIIGNIVNDGSDTKIQNFKDKAKALARIFGRVAAKGSVRVITAGILKATDISEAVDEEKGNDTSINLRDADPDSLFEKEMDALIDKKLSSAKKDEATLKAFKNALGELAEEQTIVFIIDELDRCRPDYALNFIEAIKHFYTVKNVHFLLIANMDSLQSSVEHQYGNKNSLEYLQKFYDLKLHFPRPDEYEFGDIVKNYIATIFQKVSDDPKDEELRMALSKFLEDRMIKHNYSLRSLEKLAASLKFCILHSDVRALRLLPFIAILADLRLFEPRLYALARRGELKYSDLIKRYGFDATARPTSEKMDIYSLWWRYALEMPKSEEWARIRNDINSNHNLAGDGRIIQHTIKNIIEVLPSE